MFSGKDGERLVGQTIPTYGYVWLNAIPAEPGVSAEGSTHALPFDSFTANIDDGLETVGLSFSDFGYQDAPFLRTDLLAAAKLYFELPRSAVKLGSTVSCDG